MTHTGQNHRPGLAPAGRRTTRPPVRRARLRDPLVPAEWQVEILVRWLAGEVRAGLYASQGGLPATGVVARLFEIDYPLADEAVRQLAAQAHDSVDRSAEPVSPVPARGSGMSVAALPGEALDRAQVVGAAADALLGWRLHEARTPRALDAQRTRLRTSLGALSDMLSDTASQDLSLALARARFLAAAPAPFPAWAQPWHIAWLALAILALLEAHPELLTHLQPNAEAAGFASPPPECLTSGRRLTDPAERQAACMWLAEHYKAGASIPVLAEAARRSYGLIHALLAEAGTDFRPRGGPNRRRQDTEPTDSHLEST
ncbi:helix-turn-helix domain-containing protein [Streptomyces sp. NPDC048577]|uniref:helix-turn-helix domain-containing protein n=1 Tax=Streptomyces sp. NPDC048577 TaxID=3157209 RepID=UPI003433FA63